MASSWRAWVALVTSLVAMASCSPRPTISGLLPAADARRGPDAQSSGHIQHVVVMIQENRSFDDFFSTFPGADGATEGLMKTDRGDVRVKLLKASLDSNSLGHQHRAFLLEYDHGKMDGFGLVKRALQRGVVVRAGKYSYRYVDPKEIAPYWQIAQTYVLADHMFMTQSSSSFTAHQDLIAGGTPVGRGRNVIDFPLPSVWGCSGPPGTVTSLITESGKYLRDQGPFPCFTYRTMRDLLDAAGVSWLYFTNNSNAAVWNAFDAIRVVREGPEWQTNIVVPETQVFQTIQHGTLPSVTWVIPDAVNSDHPGNHSDSGPSWVASVINAIGTSAYWPSTAIIVVWDDWGGEYDHVPPPQLDGQGLGMRVPMLLISAYARTTSPSQPGFISHRQYEFGSILKFIENNWGLGQLGTSDVRARSLIDCFDFSQPPRPFSPIETKYPKEHFERQSPSGLPVDTD